ncbi:ABC transporter ATP-binding protein [Prolixibacter bellariivorans]|uniref:ABC transporter ATP-binding protein n=1 Tax=Prolixibacter bellariivorans TaxID=314319 RepID=A0A5M4AWT1_9BACT|nr:ABC transporter ATP-binding protein [Prolixibacter bellariivorans]GET32380.1 ABC transporter ATP-binding protein [Prolixibacter bellariivorans]
MSIIETKGVYKTYNTTKVPVNAVNGVDLKIEEGEFTAIVGPSGSGKTTLLNMLSGLDLPTRGDIFIENTNLKGLSSSQLIDFRLNNIGFVFQAYNLIPVLTVKENTEFIMFLQKVPKRERQKRVKELLGAVGIGDKMDYKPSQLSGGQQQRVAVARALASRPKYIIADEPTANLDSVSTSELLELMAQMNKKYNTTFIFATHDQRVMDKARRILTIEDGKILKDEQFDR